MKSQFTTNLQNILPPESVHAWTCQGLLFSFKGPEGVSKVLTGTKIRLTIFSSFAIGAENTRAFQYPTEENLTDCGRLTWELYFENSLRTYTDMKFYFVLAWETHSRNLSKHLDAPCNGKNGVQ
jgi:hypothetical protein